jgi:hypothetical protein
MSATPVICFGQQPCGFFPRRFLIAKIRTARKLQASIGGELVFFYHDSDHDPRETKTILRHRAYDQPMDFNFKIASKLQQKYSPLYLKAVDRDWQLKTAELLPEYVDTRWVDAFARNRAADVAAFCLEMYREMGSLEGVRVARSSDPQFRRAACDIPKCFVDVPYEGETVRARFFDDALKLHRGGDSYVTLPPMQFTKEQISPSRDTRLRWMQSVLHCTHYVCGMGELEYLKQDEAPEITFVNRESIDRSEEAYADIAI